MECLVWCSGVCVRVLACGFRELVRSLVECLVWCSGVCRVLACGFRELVCSNSSYTITVV